MFSFAQHNEPVREAHFLFGRAGNGDSESGDDLLKATPRAPSRVALNVRLPSSQPWLLPSLHVASN